MLIHMGVPILLVSERLGHEDIETTLQTYGHLYPTQTEGALRRMDEMVSGCLEDPRKGKGWAAQIRKTAHRERRRANNAKLMPRRIKKATQPLKIKGWVAFDNYCGLMV